MLPAISGFISVKDLSKIFSNSSEWITIHQSKESIEDPEYSESYPFVYMTIQIVPGEPVQTDWISNESGFIEIIKIKRKSTSIITK
jgi:hypothetical protein